MAATISHMPEASTASESRKEQQPDEAFQEMCDQIARLSPSCREAVARHAHVSDTAYDAWLDEDGSALLYALESKGILTRANLPLIVEILEESGITAETPALISARALLEGGFAAAARVESAGGTLPAPCPQPICK